MQRDTQEQNYVLGIDIGTHSVGWALLKLGRGKPCGIERAGVRIFEAGVEETAFEKGRAEPPGQKRRLARTLRRQTERRARRKAKLLHVLQRAGLLPPGEAAQVLPDLDRRILSRRRAAWPGARDALPYWLRARALDNRLEPHEFGRALYHLGQRRGFLSNRRAPVRKNEEAGKVKTGISTLWEQMQKAAARTLGELFAGLDPHEERIRERYTSRDMYQQEFEAIWTAQAAHHPAILTDELKARVHDAIFFQRPLRNQSYLAGNCSLENDAKHAQRRARWACLPAQHFRMLQKLNDTRILAPNAPERPLSDGERQTVLAELDRKKELKFSRIRKLLGLSDEHLFNWETGGEDRLVGNTTNARLAKVFGKCWWELSPGERDQVVEDIRSYEKAEALARRGREHWGLDDQAAKALSELSLEDGYCRLSLKAIGRLLPEMEKGRAYMDVVRELYPDRWAAGKAVDRLPALAQTDMALTNPVVRRCLTELRKVVNAVVRRYGKPSAVRIELARDLRKSAKQREETWKRNRRNQEDREAAAQKLLQEADIANPSRADVEKLLLAQECGWHCPYTGRGFGMADLFGPHPQFDVEHIVPFSRSLDNSFLNKTICEVRENRARKRNQTPFEAYGSNTERWNGIIARVQAFDGTAARAKLRRFQQQEVEDLNKIAERELNDTRYAALLAVQYVGMLYGGAVDAGGKRRVQVAKGGTTGYLRDMYGLNFVLGDGRKVRDDHRHHAVDAVAIALTDPAALKLISQAADNDRRAGRVSFGAVTLPWADFIGDIQAAIDAVHVSHRPRRKVNGPLHEETLYGPRGREGDGRPTSYAQRMPLEKLHAKDVDRIPDPAVREAVRRKLEEVGGSPAQAFKDPANHPDRKGGIPIHKVRLPVNINPVRIGSGPTERHVLPGSNHHMEILEVTDAKGRVKWTGRLVNRLEAKRRVWNREPVVDRNPKDEFRFTLSSGDMVELDAPEGGRALYAVRGVSEDRVQYVRATDARRKADIIAAKDWHNPRVNTLSKLHCQRVVVTPLGEVRYAND